jgi:hypothetical protein
MLLIFRKSAVMLLSLASLIAIVTVACEQSPDVKYAAVSANPSAKPTPQPTPNADQAAGLVTRFYRDLDSGTKASIADLATIVSRDFIRNHHDDMVVAYLDISDPKVQIRSISGSTVTYTLDYSYETNRNGKLLWERSGRWILNHGSKSGWILDNDKWTSAHLIAVSTAANPEAVAVHDIAFADGHHEFTYHGTSYSFTASRDNWRVSAMATPAPIATAAPTTVEAAQTPVESSAAAGEASEVSAPSYVPPPPTSISSNCEEVSVEGVYDDGKILSLDDGRHLRLDDVDAVTSSVWVAPFDGLICGAGDRFINKDDNEGVDLAP